MKRIIAVLALFAMLISLGTTASAEKYKTFESNELKYDNFTFDEIDAIYTATQFVSLQYDYMYVSAPNDTLRYTIDSIEDSDKELIIQKAEENEHEIRSNHRFYMYDQINFRTIVPFPEYETIPMRTLIESFPDYLVQYERYSREYNFYNKNYIMFSSSIHAPGIYLSDSGFAYVTFYNYLIAGNEVYTDGGINDSVWVQVLLFHIDDRWIVCDVLKPNDSNENDFAHNHRFSFDKETVDEAIKVAYKESLRSNNENSKEVRTNEITACITWGICGIEAITIIALIIVLTLKRKNEASGEKE